MFAPAHILYWIHLAGQNKMAESSDERGANIPLGSLKAYSPVEDRFS
jgi:hypothetical protein